MPSADRVLLFHNLVSQGKPHGMIGVLADRSGTGWQRTAS
jgi:hypothetical protein